MLMSEFARATGLSPETVRFYVGRGLLRPSRSAVGGSNPYQVFSADDVTTARMILLQKSLGYSLAEIAELNEAYRSGARSAARTAEVLRAQIRKLEGRRTELDTALDFLREKLAWTEAGKRGKAPRLGSLDGHCPD
ncbi:MerR family transcriptional regulator [Piscinibacter gummiphilus]|uniref:MerR family transcriptional regulator n=1 Tax=Piscinibacter gummiphilus TaxID=946333 RepID=A0A1W6L8J6_9BURK|nr:MerR family transcriptional regulator [Piscinibacter gummiphilus]ARN20651.1 MerR family transcriptional regulator [Piscinibacter gummiphilus]ATU65328.1 MerR family transcriptional regulator [Piscinibacter gummiphilus]GLS94470.1 MerR family transcriptional regulator [Piscinibacter gummiphilus]